MQGVGGVQSSNCRLPQVQKNITRTPKHSADHTLHCIRGCTTSSL